MTYPYFRSQTPLDSYYFGLTDLDATTKKTKPKKNLGDCTKLSFWIVNPLAAFDDRAETTREHV